MKVANVLVASVLGATFCSAFAAEKISLDLQGNKETVAKLGKLTSLKKDEFEKSTDFTKRLCEQTYKILGITDKTPIAIGIEQGKFGTVARHYDTDKQAFVFYALPGGNHFHASDGFNDRFQWNTSFDPYKHEGIRITEEYSEAPSMYSGKNAFGVSKDVKVG